jgi:3-deoxy-D-manno-octulosonic-acid transferase
MYSIYNILYFFVLLFIMPYQYFKRRAGLRRRWLTERLGLLPSVVYANRPVWIHAVSVGEVLATIPLLKGLKTLYPEREIVLSTVTDTGQKVARERAGELARIIYVPFDMIFSVANAYKAINPALFIIMETELWPVMIHLFNRQGTPVLLMNGRLSEKSVKGYRKLRFFFEKVLGDISFFCMQDEVYAGRIISLGAARENVRATGNFKFDTKPSAPVPGWTRMLRGQVLIAGSTHRSEEELVIDAFTLLLADYPALNLIVAPRHPERFREVEALIKTRGIKYIKRSEIKNSEEGNESLSGMIVILDVMGELASVYGAADIAIMGGSFIEHGGQNPLEPAYWGRAIICGPHMENFPFFDEFYRQGAARRSGTDNLYGIIRDMLGSPQELRNMGEAAKELYYRNAGATEKALGIISKYL